MAIGSSTPADTKSNSSTFGKQIDVVAPGTKLLLLTAQHSRIRPEQKIGNYLWFTEDGGTSSASPHVTGLAGLLFSIHPDWTAQQVRDRIIATADDIEAPGFDERTGHGRINAGRALC